jgi:hypothetical protein
MNGRVTSYVEVRGLLRFLSGTVTDSYPRPDGQPYHY